MAWQWRLTESASQDVQDAVAFICSSARPDEAGARLLARAAARPGVFKRMKMDLYANSLLAQPQVRRPGSVLALVQLLAEHVFTHDGKRDALFNR
jgi:hypothetical protein